VEEVCEKNCSRELEITLSPKLGFPCSFHVATDNIVAFELTRLQDFHVIIIAQNKSSNDYFNTSNLLTMLKAFDGCCPPIIFLTDDETQLAGQRSICNEFLYVRCCVGNEFVLDELCAAILAATIQTSTTFPTDLSLNDSISLPYCPIIVDDLTNNDNLNSGQAPVDYDLYLYEDIPTACPEHDEFDVLLSRLFDDDQFKGSMHRCSNEGNRLKRIYSFDSDISMDQSVSLTYEHNSPDKK
jgi:hypothetical protein